MKTKPHSARTTTRRVIGAVVVLALLGGGGFLAWRTYRLADVALDMEQQVRYLIENGGTIGAKPADATFALDYLEAIFGDNPELLSQLEAILQRGLEETPALNLGEVAAMVVTYRQDEEGHVTDVAAQVVGGFPISRMVPQFNRDGFFKMQIDEGVWNMGNTMLSFVGRDMVLFADEAVAAKQTEIIEGVMGGDILPLASTLNKTLYYTAVFPDPRRIVPPQLRHHIQAVVMKGSLASYQGQWELLLLTSSQRSANYTIAVLDDIKRATEIALKTKFKGIVRDTEWGPTVDPWWAYAMAQTSEMITIEREDTIIRMKVSYDRIMVNATLKTLERFGRDWKSMRLRAEDKLDPRVADAMMATKKPIHYWSEAHQWGPNWPIAPARPLDDTETPDAAEDTPPANPTTDS